jgi:hypothetical protein
LIKALYVFYLYCDFRMIFVQLFFYVAHLSQIYNLL